MENKGSQQTWLSNIHAKLAANLSLIIYAILIIVPMTMVFITSFKNTAQLYANPMGMPESWALDNYIKLFQSENMFIYFKNSIFVTAVCVISILLLSSMISYAIIRMPKWWGNIIFGLFSLGMMIPTQVNMIPQ